MSLYLFMLCKQAFLNKIFIQGNKNEKIFIGIS